MWQAVPVKRLCPHLFPEDVACFLGTFNELYAYLRQRRILFMFQLLSKARLTSAEQAILPSPPGLIQLH